MKLCSEFNFNINPMLHSPLILVFSSTSVGLRLFHSLHFPLHFSTVLAFGYVRLHDENNQKKNVIMNYTTDLLLQYSFIQMF